MALQFAATLRSQQSAMLKFLLDIFHADPQLNSFQPPVIEWKYFSPHPGWIQPRSFLLQKEKEIVGHGGVWPIRLGCGGEGVQAIHLVDWAASPATLGAGVHVLRSIAQMGDVMITVGGSPDTRKILPRLGYKNAGAMRRYVRVVRPWLQFRTRTRYDWKTPLRFVRNSGSAFNPVPRIPGGWRAEQVSRFGSELEGILKPGGSAQDIRPIRTVAGLNYMLDCPAAEFSGFTVFDGMQLLGYFVLAKVGHQARIVDLGISGQDATSWRCLCSVAARTAGGAATVAEVIAGTSSPRMGDIWKQLGFRPCRQDSILYWDRRNLLSPGTLLNLNLIDGDLSFMYNPSYPYIS